MPRLSDVKCAGGCNRRMRPAVLARGKTMCRKCAAQERERVGKKQCPECEKTLPLVAFSRKPSGAVQSWCIDCTKAASRRWEKVGMTHKQRQGDGHVPRQPDPLNLVLREFRIVGDCADLPTVPTGLVWRIAA